MPEAQASGLHKDYRKNIVVGVYSNIFDILDAIKNVPIGTYKELQVKAKRYGGSFSVPYHDARILGLYNVKANGVTKRFLTELGERWHFEAAQNEEHLPSARTMREAALNVPLFELIYREHPTLNEQEQVLGLVKIYLDGKVDPVDLSRAAHRYVEAVHQGVIFISPSQKTLVEVEGAINAIGTFLDEKASPTNLYPFDEVLHARRAVEKLIRRFGRKRIQVLVDDVSQSLPPDVADGRSDGTRGR